MQLAPRRILDCSTRCSTDTAGAGLGAPRTSATPMADRRLRVAKARSAGVWNILSSSAAATLRSTHSPSGSVVPGGSAGRCVSRCAVRFPRNAAVRSAEGDRAPSGRASRMPVASWAEKASAGSKDPKLASRASPGRAPRALLTAEDSSLSLPATLGLSGTSCAPACMPRSCSHCSAVICAGRGVTCSATARSGGASTHPTRAHLLHLHTTPAHAVHHAARVVTCGRESAMVRRNFRACAPRGTHRAARTCPPSTPRRP